MYFIKKSVVYLLSIILFWILLFDFQRIIFSIHHLEKFTELGLLSWLSTFYHSFRVDLSMAAYLTALPFLFVMIHFGVQKKWTKNLYKVVLGLEVLFVILVHVGEINAYTEWNHKLTSRVFTHLSNPDEVFRTADYSMIFWYVVYGVIESFFAYKLFKLLLVRIDINWTNLKLRFKKLVFPMVSFVLLFPALFITMRGGVQQIPLNIDAAYFSKNPTLNDLSVNSTYFFINSYMLFLKSDLSDFMPDMQVAEAEKIVADLYDYPRSHDVRVLSNDRPNVVFVILESWAAEAIGALSETKGATPNFDNLAEEGLLFTQMYSTSNTSEKGNSAIFSGYPAIPGMAITSFPEKHRKIATLNEDLREWGYSSNYIFSGDLKYGNIGSYFMEHGFDDVKDENYFPNDLPKGKLNYYDEDLFRLFLDRINKSKEPFLHCAFTGSTHSPYDHPVHDNQNWKGTEANFMNSIIYADESLGDFIENCKKESWYKNSLFVIVADHGHGTPNFPGAHTNEFYRIPFLLWGPALKNEYKGQRNDKVGSQIDIPAILLGQLGGDLSRYPWSKDLLNPNVNEFAFHTIIDGYGWVSNKSKLTYHNAMKGFLSERIATGVDAETEKKNAQAFLLMVYENYKAL